MRKVLQSNALYFIVLVQVGPRFISSQLLATADFAHPHLSMQSETGYRSCWVGFMLDHIPNHKQTVSEFVWDRINHFLKGSWCGCFGPQSPVHPDKTRQVRKHCKCFRVLLFTVDGVFFNNEYEQIREAFILIQNQRRYIHNFFHFH